MRRILILWTGFGLFIMTTCAQPKGGLYGFSTTISKGLIPTRNIVTNNGTLSMGMAYMPSDRMCLRAELGFLSQKDTSGTTNSEFTFGMSSWYYLQTSESVSTFLGGTIGFGSETDADGKGTSLLDLEGYFGAEYWFSQRFAWFGHIGLAYASYTVAEKKASDIFTSASTGVSWYF